MILDPAFLAAFRAQTSTQAQVYAALPHDRVAIIFVMLQLSDVVNDSSDSSKPGPYAPSGSVREAGAGFEKTVEKEGREAGSSGIESTAAGKNRQAGDARVARLSRLRQRVETHRSQT